MKNNYCCDLEYAKELKELGLKQESLWYYRILAHAESGFKIVLGEPIANEDCKYSAYTVGELGIITPPQYRNDIKYCPITDTWYYTYEINDEKESNCRAMHIIYLIKQKLVSVEDLNKVL